MPLRFTKTTAGRYYAVGAEHSYLIRQWTARSWRLTITGQALTEVSADFHDTMKLAVAVANCFEAAEPSTLFVQQSRITRAVIQAYEQD